MSNAPPSVPLHEGYQRPKDTYRPIVQAGWFRHVIGERLVPSERHWQGAWVTLSGHPIVAWTDNYLMERLATERPLVRNVPC